MEEKLRILGSADELENTGRLTQLEERGEIVDCARIREIERALLDAKVVLGEPQNTAKIKPTVVNVPHRRVSGDDHQGNAKTVLVVALTLSGHR